MTTFRRFTSLAAAAALLLALGGCVLAIGTDGDSHTHAYTAGEWVKHQADVSNAERALASKVVAALAQDPVLKDADINVRVNGSIVTLTGQVFDLPTYEHAIEVVQGVDGVRSIVSRIELNTSK